MNPRRLIGLSRSLLIYAAPWRQPGLRRFYAPLIDPDRPVFDIGAHLGDRSLAFAALGAPVVALEPQPALRPLLAWRLRRYPRAQVSGEAVGDHTGEATLALSDRHPTLASVNAQWRAEIGQRNASFSHVAWERTVTVPMITLETLIARHGVPGFCKIDVEGAEEAVLDGLQQPLPALSFEYVAGSLARARACVDRLEALGDYRYNVTVGEQRRLQFTVWQSAQGLVEWLGGPAQRAGSGDVYARLTGPDARDRRR
ncbi:hypothetical protein BA899_01700 [Spiribacter sp. SSL99]|uniref:FkbM family methyltransferase n=1 Tax=Spiribacter sp. SSL99 TaxID=1866884 RepID=UPI001330BF34|nr:FkbM family methyltransferase [Spiribacter sp. SSL99]KAF0285908.1 hypothetical protein BA899_01700 [Spiribacter sp. SSL99]